MAIKISGVNVIDDDQNFNVGVATVGSGNSSVTLNQNNFSGIGITMDVSSGNINASIGILTAAGISYPLGL